MRMVAVSPVSVVLLVILMTFAVMLYFLPSVIASMRGVPDVGLIFVINLLLGSTVIGWVIALYMAFRPVPPRSA